MILSLCLSVCLMMAPGQRGPDFAVPEARAHFDDAVAAFADEDYARASESLRLAYELEQFAELLYARAQAERQLEHWDTAASLYSDYLATDPPRDQADNARGPLLFCGAMAAKADVYKRQEYQSCVGMPTDDGGDDGNPYFEQCSELADHCEQTQAQELNYCEPIWNSCEPGVADDCFYEFFECVGLEFGDVMSLWEVDEMTSFQCYEQLANCLPY